MDHEKVGIKGGYMENNRIKIYGKDADNKVLRAFDLVSENDQKYFETVTRKGIKIRISVEDFLSAMNELDLKTE